MINNLAYTPILRYSDTPILRYSDNRNSLAPNAVSAKNQRTGLTVDPNVAKEFADHAIYGTLNPFRYIGTEYIGNGVAEPSVFDSDPAGMTSIVLKSIQDFLSRLEKLPDRFELVRNPEFKQYSDSFDIELEKSVSSTPFLLEDTLASPEFSDPFLYSRKPLSISLDDKSPKIFTQVFPYLDDFLNKNQSDKPTQTIPAFNPELIRKKTMNALEGRGLIRKRELS